MKFPAIYAAITGHGFGHASRFSCAMAELRRMRPDIEIHINSNQPEWFFRTIIPGEFTLRSVPLDTGVVQRDSLRVDLNRTKEILNEIYKNKKEIIEQESSYVRKNNISLVIGDIPSLCADIAKSAGVECWMSGNFGWDFIYQEWEGFENITEWFRDSYVRCARLYRLPFHEPMAAFPRIIDVGFSGQHPSKNTETIMRELAVEKETCVLLTFGGLGISEIPYQNLRKFDGNILPRRHFLTFDREAPDMPNLTRLGHQMRPVDIMPMCERILTKPGYGTFCEAYRTGVPVICVERHNFPETPLLLDGLKSFFHQRIVSEEEFYSDDWSFLAGPLNPPARLHGSVDRPPPDDGNRRIALGIAEYLS